MSYIKKLNKDSLIFKVKTPLGKTNSLSGSNPIFIREVWGKKKKEELLKKGKFSYIYSNGWIVDVYVYEAKAITFNLKQKRSKLYEHFIDEIICYGEIINNECQL